MPWCGRCTDGRPLSCADCRATRRRTRRDRYRFLLRFRPPYDWSRLLAFLSPRAIPGVEHVGRDASYGRTISIDGRYGWIAARLAPGTHAVELRVRIDDPRSLMRIVGRARALFDLGADPAQIRAALSDDEWLAPRLAACPGLRVPGAWDRFELTIRAILGQQITVKGATTLAGRLVKSFGEPFDGGEALTHVFPTPARLAGADLSGLGLTRARETTIREFAGAVADGRVTLERPEELRALPGIGDWTVEYVAMRGFGEPDAFPAGDLVLLKTSGLRTRRALVARAEAWRPWRAYAAMHLWQGA